MLQVAGVADGLAGGWQLWLSSAVQQAGEGVADNLLEAVHQQQTHYQADAYTLFRCGVRGCTNGAQRGLCR